MTKILKIMTMLLSEIFLRGIMLKKQFKPSLIATILTLIALVMLLKLGFWQLERAKEKLNIERNFAQRPLMPALSEQDLEKLPQNDFTFRRVKLSGFFDNEQQFLLDNQHADHRIGFRVLTPFILQVSGQRVLIDRGFIPRSNNEMNFTPQLKPIHGIQNIEAFIEPDRTKDFVLGTIQQTKNWPMVIEAIDFAFIQKQLNQKVIPVVLQLDAANKNSFLQSQQAVQVSHQRHIAYAVQWFLLAAVLVIVFVIASFKKVNNDE